MPWVGLQARNMRAVLTLVWTVFPSPGTLSNLQTIRHKLADMKTEICVARAFIDQCIELHCQKRLTQEMASMAKLKGTELEFAVADACLQMHGGWGYMW